MFICLLAVTLAACAEPQAETPEASSPVNVLTVGGGTSHDFDRWFDAEDSQVLESSGAVAVYADTPAAALRALQVGDVLRLATNQSIPADLRRSIFDFVDAGNGLLVEHPGAWYNWEDWPEYNRLLVGGGSQSHRDYGSFEVDVIVPDHPIMKDVPTSFTIEDELYRFEQDPDGSSIDVLATAEEVETGDVFPIVWTVSHPDARIVVNTLGHDGAAHQHEAYRKILQNSVRWAAPSADEDGTTNTPDTPN